MSKDTEINRKDVKMDGNWIKIGEHSNQAVLKKTVMKIRAKWLDRYDFRICESDSEKQQYELQLKHR